MILSNENLRAMPINVFVMSRTSSNCISAFTIWLEATVLGGLIHSMPDTVALCRELKKQRPAYNTSLITAKRMIRTFPNTKKQKYTPIVVMKLPLF